MALRQTRPLIKLASVVNKPVRYTSSFQNNTLDSQNRYSQQNSGSQNAGSSNEYSPNFKLMFAPIAFASAAVVLNKNEKEGQDPEKEKEVAISQKDLQKMNYQNRIRRYSTPDKNFRLFATVKVLYNLEKSNKTKGIVYMTPDDFVRSITPGSMQPNDFDLDSYDNIPEKLLSDYLSKGKGKGQILNSHQTPNGEKAPANIFDDITKEGLLTFSDYIFLLTVISTSARHWRILFKVFDQNGDGEVDQDEFRTVMKLAQNSSSTGERHRDTGDNRASLNKKSAIINYFFKKEGDGKLKLEQFEQFYERLRHDILRIQFNKEHPSKKDDKIKLLSLCKMLLAYIERVDTSSASELNRCKKVLKELDLKPNTNSEGVTFGQVEGLFKFLSCVEDIEMALDMHTSANVELTKKEFKHVAYVVANERLDEKLVDVVYAVFDQDGSGGLSHKEFLKTIKSRASFGLDKPKDTGLWRLFNSFYACGKMSFKNMFGL